MKKSKLGAVLSVYCLMSMVYGLAHAAPLTADKPLSSRAGEYSVLSVASGTVIYAGALVAVDATDYGVPASDTAALKVVGTANEGVDQRAGVYAIGKTVLVRRGVFLFKNGGAFTDANIGDWAYVIDDQTVGTAADMTNDILAGVIIDVETAGVWVNVGAVNRAGAIAGATLSTSGNGAIGGTLAVTGNSTLGGTAGITGNTTVGGTLGVTGNTSVGGTLGVTGAATLKATTINGSLTVTNAVAFPNLPTATNGLSAGALWSNSGAVTVMQ